MQTVKLKEGLYWNGIIDKDLRVFDIIMETEFGTTYNSYLLVGSERTALVEAAKAPFTDAYIEMVSKLTDLKKIDYIIVNHTEPDHTGSIERMLDINPDLTIMGTMGAVGFLKKIVNRPFKSIIAKENDTLSLGDRTLQFMILPNLHWPDTMFTYLIEDKVLFPCDAFGAHYAHDGVLRSALTDVKDYMGAVKYYFDNIIAPFKNPFMTRALDRIKDLEISMICTGHGPVLDTGFEDVINAYKDWCSDKKSGNKKTVVIPYVSAYGYTAELAAEIARGIRDSGDIDVRCYDLVSADIAAVMEDLSMADGLLFGTPTILGDALKPIWDITTSMCVPVYSGRLASAFGSYGWSGEGVPHIIERLKQLKLNVVDGYRVRFKPNPDELEGAYAFGRDFARILLKK